MSAEGLYIFAKDETGAWVQLHEHPITEEALEAA